MVWLLPAALAGLVAAIGPLIVHLLRRQRARTLVVPTVRFIPTVDQSVVRVRMPADVPLLLLRMAIVACAALGLARPLFLTDARAAVWSGRVARAAVVDISDPATAAPGREAAGAELQSAAFAHKIEAAQLGPAIRRAAAWLDAAAPARREMVIVSGFRHGAIDESLLGSIPAAIGIRLVPVRTTAPANREIAAGPALSVGGVLDRQVRIEETTTAVTFTPQSVGMTGLTLLTAPQDAKDAAALLRVVSRAGAYAPSASEPVVLRFTGGAPLPAAGKQRADGWAFHAALRLLRRADAINVPPCAEAALKDCATLTAAVGTDGALLVDVNAAPGTLLAAEVLKAVLDGRRDPRLLEGQEIAQIPSETLEAWGRAPAPADTAAWQQSDESDGRWFWLAALGLLAVEGLARRSSSAPIREVDAHAA